MDKVIYSFPRLLRELQAKDRALHPVHRLPLCVQSSLTFCALVLQAWHWYQASSVTVTPGMLV